MMVCGEPVTLSAPVVNVAVDVPFAPGTRATSPLMGFEPSKKSTVPGGGSVLGALAVTVNVKVTGSPNTVGDLDVLTLADVVPCATVNRVGGAEVLVSKFGSPL